MMTSRSRSTLPCALAFALGCGAQAAPAQSAPAGSTTSAPDATDDVCTTNARAASAAIRAVIAANQACAKDEECIFVPQGGCQDQCSGMMGASGKDAYDKAMTEIGAKYCAPMQSAHCPAPPSPPCAPPPPGKCRAGRCGS